MSLSRILRVSAASAALAFGATACGGSDDSATADTTPAPERTAVPQTPSIDVRGGATNLRLDSRTARVLEVGGVKLTAIGDASGSVDRLRFPITGGEVSLSPPGGRIEHAGGLRFSVGGRGVDATDLVIDPAADVVTAEVAGRRVPLLALDLELPRDTPAEGQALVIPGTASLIGGSLVATLSDELGVDVLRGGLDLGRIEVSTKS